MEYAYIVWDNCSNHDKDKLENVQYEAARVICGAIKGTQRVRVYEELALETLSTRRYRRKLLVFQDLVQGRSPKHLLTLLPEQVSQRTNYPLRNSQNINTVLCRTALYYNSFFPSVARSWNALSSQACSIQDHSRFKSMLSANIPQFNSLYNFGSRTESMIHAKMRMGCSPLAKDLYNMHIVDRANCSCGYPTENVQHFFFECPNYNVARNTFIQQLQSLQLNYDTNVLLYGHNESSYEINCKLFIFVHRYIKATKRLSS